MSDAEFVDVVLGFKYVVVVLEKAYIVERYPGDGVSY